MRVSCDSGSGCVNETLACVIRRFAPTKSAPELNSVFTACSRPNSMKAAISDSSVSVVRVFL